MRDSKRIEELERRVRELEARPPVVVIQPPAVVQPNWIYQPPLWPQWPYFWPEITCETVTAVTPGAPRVVKAQDWPIFGTVSVY